ncbi:MAG: conjugal transfer protein TraX [Acetatifactor sp.]|nr:conjugal transfer protein TraX [Acetatifactor sp.]
MGQNSKLQISSAGLHILAMGLMLCDHLWAMLFPAEEWLTCIGRIAFPIFAFMVAEGYSHTHNLRRYLLRMLLGALLAEIPFDLMYSSSIFYPFHQNVLWTFLLSLLLIVLIEKIKSRFRPVAALLLSAAVTILGFVIGYIAMVDYYGIGILTVLMFHFFRKQSWKNRLCQFICLYILNVKLLGGYYYDVQVFGFEIEVVQQGFALLALIPIWLYQGRQGIRNKFFQYFCYAFYPVHMLLLFVVREWMLR